MPTQVRLDRGASTHGVPQKGRPPHPPACPARGQWFIVTLGTEAEDPAVRIQGTSMEDGTPLIYQHLRWEAGRDPHSTNKGESSAK